MDSAAMSQLTGRYRVGADNRVTIALRNGRLFREPLREPPTELVHIGNGEFISRMDERSRRFTKAADGTMALRVTDTNTGELLSELPRMKDNEFVPFELVQRGDREGAVKAYMELRTVAPEEMAVKEQILNSNGYDLMNAGLLIQARDLFYINKRLYPESANVYDSYAEACLKLGDKREALINYKRAFAMDPKNTNAPRIVAHLEQEGVRVE